MDVFEDFYPHYGVTQREFATRWVGSGNHAFVALLEREVGDVTWYAFSLRPELDEARHQVVGCRIKMLRSSWLHRQAWRAFYLPRMAWRWRRYYSAYETVASYSSLLSLRLVRTLLHDRPDVLFVQDYANGRFDVLLFMAWLLGVPLVARHSGSRPERYRGKWLRRWTLPRADCLIASGREERNLLIERFRVREDRVRIILTPIDTDRFAPLAHETACERAGLDPTRRHLLFVGRLDDRVKRISAILRSFATLAPSFPTADLLIAGEGSDGDRLRSMAAELAPGRVRFLGWVNTTQTAALYAAAECLVLASRREGFPAVVGEAMACGTPVVSSRVGAVCELITDQETGWTFDSGSDDETTARLTERLAYVLRNPAAIADMRPRVRAAALARVAPAVVAANVREGLAAAGVRHL